MSWDFKHQTGPPSLLPLSGKVRSPIPYLWVRWVYTTLYLIAYKSKEVHRVNCTRPTQVGSRAHNPGIYNFIYLCISLFNWGHIQAIQAFRSKKRDVSLILFSESQLTCCVLVHFTYIWSGHMKKPGFSSCHFHCLFNPFESNVLTFFIKVTSPIGHLLKTHLGLKV